MNKIDFENIYSWFKGTIYPPYNCAEITNCDAKCCSPYYFLNEATYIYFLPGEFEFLKNKLKENFPFKEVIPQTKKYHCFLKKCPIYEIRPIDCRSYPVWPLIHNGRFVGFLDLRNNRCPIKIIPDWFLKEIKNSWSKLLEENKWLINWLEKDGPQPKGNNFIFFEKTGGKK